MTTWFKVYREIFDSDLWHDVTTFRVFIYLIGKASFKDGFKYKGITLDKGQYIRSYRKLADDLSYKEGRGYKKYSLNTIKRCVQKLVDAERLNVKETELGTLFTILNYAKYQDLEDSNESKENAQSEEVRTNSERKENEDRTKGEQYQELKNLRIKELYTTTPTTDAIQFYQNNFPGEPSAFERDSMMQWIEDCGDDLVIEALKRSLDRNKRNWGYAKSILNSWHHKNIKTVEQAKAEEVQFQNQRTHQQSKKPYYPRQQSAAVVPDWFKQNKHKQKQVEPEEKQGESVIDVQQRLQEYLQASGGSS
ncbi:hypothetical protein AQ616_17850 [Oceanobacillus sp. E9]|uniref:DnaD domain-containing protein n=1 Tax=Oceanobacillus sp. E9 TaxID=1742575 RepID=UPI00084EC79B|nr:DnaD domain protein [Oceanobacillus sp. E9]OEH53144.1 hypothetical protein AQ616_17850 [Oceanobacillus sp. E9]